MLATRPSTCLTLEGRLLGHIEVGCVRETNDAQLTQRGIRGELRAKETLLQDAIHGNPDAALHPGELLPK